jgi:hypothetical protein
MRHGIEVNERGYRETLKSLEPITRGHYMGETDLLASPTRSRLESGSVYKKFDVDMIRRGCSTVTLVRREVSRKILEPTGFEPVTSSMPLRRSTN